MNLLEQALNGLNNPFGSDLLNESIEDVKQESTTIQLTQKEYDAVMESVRDTQLRSAELLQHLVENVVIVEQTTARDIMGRADSIMTEFFRGGFREVERDMDGKEISGDKKKKPSLNDIPREGPEKKKKREEVQNFWDDLHGGDKFKVEMTESEFWECSDYINQRYQECTSIEGKAKLMKLMVEMTEYMEALSTIAGNIIDPNFRNGAIYIRPKGSYSDDDKYVYYHRSRPIPEFNAGDEVMFDMTGNFDGPNNTLPIVTNLRVWKPDETYGATGSRMGDSYRFGV